MKGTRVGVVERGLPITHVRGIDDNYSLNISPKLKKTSIYRGARYLDPPLPNIKKAITFLFFEIATCNFDLRTRENFSFLLSYPGCFFVNCRLKWRNETFLRTFLL